MKKHWLLGCYVLFGCSGLLYTPSAVFAASASNMGNQAKSLNTAINTPVFDQPDSMDQPDHQDEFDDDQGLAANGEALAKAPASYDDVPIDAIRRFVSIYEKVKENYVEPVDDNELFENALQGLLSQLDPYSAYLDAKTYEALLDFTEGEVAQTGLTIRPSQTPDAVWQIESVESGSPAARAGLKEGMLLHKIAGKNARNLSLHDIEQLLRGAVGTTVELTVAEQEKHAVVVRVVRATPEDNAVKEVATNNGVLVLKVAAFQEKTVEQIKNSIDRYQKNNTLTAVLFDLRDNPGGLLSAAVEVADLFLKEGLIVYTQGRGEPEQRYQALPSTPYAQLPVGVLVNHYSASAAEVLAGAFQDHKRAVVIGESSYGKGSVQKLWPIADGHAIKLTVARYYTPSGRLIEGKGITPDILIKDEPATATLDATLDNSVSMLRKYYQLP